MKTSTFIIFTLCLYISVVVARPEPGHSSESHSHERFDGYGHSHEDFSGEDLFNRRGGNSMLCFITCKNYFKKNISSGHYGNRQGYYGNNYGGYQGGYYQPGYRRGYQNGYNPLG